MEGAEFVSGRFADLETAEDAVGRLLGARIPENAISVMAPSDGEFFERSLSFETGVVPGVLAGARLAGLVERLRVTFVAGGLAGPTGGPVAVLAGGGSSGTLARAVAELAWWRHTAERHAQQFADDGAVWVAVRHETLSATAARVLAEAGGAVGPGGSEVGNADRGTYRP